MLAALHTLSAAGTRAAVRRGATQSDAWAALRRLTARPAAAIHQQRVISAASVQAEQTGGAVSAGASDVRVKIAPGARFRIAAGRNEVRVENVVGWSDEVVLRGTPAGGGSWSVAYSGTSPGGGPLFDVRPANGSGGNGEVDAAGAPGVLQLAVPEKWISLDIDTQGCTVSVARLVEADLRAVTAGGDVQLGTVRALSVEINTAAAAPAKATGTGGGAGGVSGGELSGTSVTVTAGGGGVRLRRLVGGSMLLVTQPPPAGGAAAAAGGAEEEAVAAATTVELGAVYGGRLRVRTGGGSVRIGTLACGADGDVAAAVAAGAAAASGSAEVVSYGGGVTLGCVEGTVVVDSDGGPIQALLQAGVVRGAFTGGGGRVELSLSPATRLRALEVVSATRLEVAEDLKPDLLVPEAAGGGRSAAPASPTSVPPMWRSRLVAAAEVTGRGGRLAMAADPGGVDRPGAAGGAGADAAAAGAGAGGEVVVVADCGTVVLKRQGWMDSVRARLAERQQAQKEA